MSWYPGFSARSAESRYTLNKELNNTFEKYNLINSGEFIDSVILQPPRPKNTIEVQTTFLFVFILFIWQGK